MTETTAFWDDLAHELEDPDFLREYVAESVRISTVDAIMNELDAARKAAGMSKADLARAIRADPATIRRLFSSEKVNPTLRTLAEVAAALGLRITVEPLTAQEHAEVTAPLVEGRSANRRKLGEHLTKLRMRKPSNSV